MSATRLEFTKRDTHLASNCGVISLNTATSNASPPLALLSVRGRWICYGEHRIARLPEDYEPRRWTAIGDWVAIALSSGQVQYLCIDRALVGVELDVTLK